MTLAQDGTTRALNSQPTDREQRLLLSAAQARRAAAAIRVDGHLNEADWADAPVLSSFRQVEPQNGAPSLFTTEVRVLFDDDYLYVGAWCADSAGASGVRVQDLRRKWDYFANDHFSVVIDPLHTERNSVAFQTTPYGAQRELEVYDGGAQFNREWEAVWRVRTVRSDSGWTAEFAIPWKTLRYRTDGAAWVVNFSRMVRRTNELSAWQPWPRQFTQHRLDYAGRLVGLDPPPQTRNVRVRPYTLVSADRLAGAGGQAAASTPVAPQLGGELTWAPSPSAVLDLTVNTDFAQVDVDRQVVNLTRFSVFFPERRQFFLENASLFDLGIGGRFVVQPFFSRRIGLSDDGEAIPIDGGARFVSRTDRQSLGAIAVRQRGVDGAGASTFGVVRGVRNVGEQGRTGGFLAVRQDAAGSGAADVIDGRTSVVAAVDGFMRLNAQTEARGMVSAFRNDQGNEGVAATYFAGRETPRLYTGILGAVVTSGYQPPTGFVSRSDVVLTSPAIIGDLRPSWRPKRIRRFRPAVVAYIYNGPTDGRLQEGVIQYFVDVIGEDGSVFYPFVETHWQRPSAPLALLPGVTIAPGVQDYVRSGVNWSTDASRRASFTTRVSTGSFFGGQLNELNATARWAPIPHVALGVFYERNQLSNIGVQDTSLTTQLFAPEFRVSFTPRVQVTSFYQYNTVARRGTLNARFAWEFAPLSYLFVVVNERRPLVGASPNEPVAQQLVVKGTWLRQF